MTSTSPAAARTSADVLTDSTRQFMDDVLSGMSQKPKAIPSKYFYDERGSRLFDRITTLPEYYPTRTELEIMRRNIDSISEHLGERVVLIEYGSGSSVKTRLLLDQLDANSAYVPIDISGDHLQRVAAELDRDYPRLKVVPVHADYSEPVVLPPLPGRKVVYYPGSTIGNFEPRDAQAFLERMRRVVGVNGAMLIGIDLDKETDVLEAAYDDSEGVTAQFNKNILARANDELGSDFNPRDFEHRAVYYRDNGRVEMHLVSKKQQEVRIADKKFRFEEDEYIHTENSYKYGIDQFAELVAAAGFVMAKSWVDSNQWFCVAYLTPNTK